MGTHRNRASAYASGCLCWLAKNSNSKLSPKFLPSFPPATNVTPNLRIRLILLKRMSLIPLVSKSEFCYSVQFVFCGVNKFLLLFFQLLSLVLLYLLYFPISMCFSYLPCLHFYLFLWALEPQKRKTIRGAFKILHRMWNTLGKNNSKKLFGML